MNGIKKMTSAAAVLVLLLLASTGSAFATDWFPGDIVNLNTFMAGVSYKDVSGNALSGSYYVTPLAYQSYLTNEFKDSASKTLFTNNVLSDYGTTKKADLTGASFQTTGWYNGVNLNFNTKLTDSTRVHIYELKQDWTYRNQFFTTGSLIIGINDDGCKNPCTDDFDDFIVAASKTAPTPLPAAVWLLGSGLLGVMGFKKTRQTV